MRSLGDSDPRQVGVFRLVAGLTADESGSVLVGTGPDGRLAAVKLVSPRLVGDPGFSARFAREVGRGPAGAFVAPVVAAGPAEAVPWVALDLPAGVSVREMVERGVLLAEDEVFRLAGGLTAALADVHRAGVAHRDLTPANVLLVEDGVRVFDFGVARAVDPDAGLAVADAEFMSPEQASGQPVTAASDVFALGAVLHLAATGRSPFVGATRGETLANVVRAQPELAVSLPPRVRRLLGDCLAADPRRRPTLEQLRAVVGVGAPVWPSLVRAMLAEQQAEVARLRAEAQVVDAPTMRIAPVAPAVPAKSRRERDRAEGGRTERWKPDRWAVFSGAAIVLAIVFAVVMFNTLTPDRPIRASEQESAAPPAPTAPATVDSDVPTTTTTTSTPVTTTTAAAPPPVPAGLITGLAGKCVDVAGANPAAGTPVQLHTCNGTGAQVWEVFPDGTVRGLGKCLDVAGGAVEDGALVQIGDCTGAGAQVWAVTSEGWIINVQSTKCLDVPANRTDDGTQLVIWSCHGQDNQRWVPPA